MGNATHTNGISLERISELQKIYGVDKLQESINSGQIWKREGSSGRFAMNCLENGICMLAECRTYDYWGNIIPCRQEVQPHSKGSLDKAITFWERIENDDAESLEYIQSLFGEII